MLYKIDNKAIQTYFKCFLFSTYRHHCGMGAAAGCISGIGAIESGSIGDTFSGDASGCGGCGGCGG